MDIPSVDPQQYVLRIRHFVYIRGCSLIDGLSNQNVYVLYTFNMCIYSYYPLQCKHEEVRPYLERPKTQPFHSHTYALYSQYSNKIDIESMYLPPQPSTGHIQDLYILFTRISFFRVLKTNRMNFYTLFFHVHSTHRLTWIGKVRKTRFV